MKQQTQLALIVSIIERGCGNRLTALYTDHQVFTHLRCEGTGTATLAGASPSPPLSRR